MLHLSTKFHDVKQEENIFNYSINALTFPYTVFNASKYASTTNPTYCALSYNALTLDGSSINATSFMYFNTMTGTFQITGY